MEESTRHETRNYISAPTKYVTGRGLNQPKTPDTNETGWYYGCDMNRSLNIPITDEFVWDAVVKTVAKSSTLKEGFKTEVLQSKFATDEEIKSELKNQKTKSQRLRKELGRIQSSIADLETNNLLQKYDAEVYSKIITNLNEESVKKKDEIEQTRLRVLELGREHKWWDWVEKHAGKVDELVEYTDQEKREYLEGIVDRIEVFMSKETKDHYLDIVFQLRLVDDGVQYLDENDKYAGFQIVEGKNTQTIAVKHSVVKVGALSRS